MFSKIEITKKGVRTMSPERRQARIEKRRRFLRKAGRGLLWTLAIGFVAHLSLNIYVSIQLNRELAAIRQKGDPVRFSELEPPATPDSQNAAVLYQQAIKSLRFSAGEKNALQTRERNMTAQEQKLIESALRNNQKGVALARRAAALTQCHFPLDWQGNPTTLLFPYLAEVRELARLLFWDAKEKAAKGNREAALSDVRALFGMSRHLSGEPVLIGFLVSQAVDSIGHRTLGQTLEQVPLSVTEARNLEASLPKVDWTRAFRHCMTGERTFGLSAFESFTQSTAPPIGNSDENTGSSEPNWITYPLLWIVRPVLRLDEVQTLRMWRRIVDSPGSQQVPTSPVFRRAYDEAVRKLPFYAPLTKVLFPVFSKSSDNRDRAEVRRRQREAALALNCFRTAHGHYPAQLQEAATLWGNPLPLDPYSQKPFVYRSDGKTFDLYSIGVNRVDDGGKDPFMPGASVASSADDIIWAHSNYLATQP